MAKYASRVVKQAQKWIGKNEADGTHKEIIDIYNSHKPLARGYAVKYTDAWCATFTSAVAIKLGYADIIPIECSCSKLIEKAKEMGIWVENENRKPNVGELMLYDWDDNGSGDNKGKPEHVGIVEKCDGNIITVIEGNYANAVKSRKIAVNGKFIRGYITPKYDAENTSSSTSAKNNKIDTVKEVQKWANTNYKSGLVVDGIYGAATKKALVKILQTEINKTYNAKLVVDGIWGVKTKAACPVLKRGSKNNIVGVLQALLICNGYKKAYLDKDYGSATTSAVKLYQGANGLFVDGEAGKNTFAKLCG